MYLVFFLSGFAALVFETLFFQLSGLFLGNSVGAVAIVLASFMGGMAVGSALAARVGTRTRSALQTYVLLEVAIAVAGVGLTYAFLHGAGPARAIFGLAPDQPLLRHFLRAAIAFAALFLPAAAMGATLPVMVRIVQRRAVPFGRTLGRLYGWNTIGAVSGVLAGEVLLVRHFGLTGAAFAAATVNLGAAALAFFIAGRKEEPLGETPEAPADGSLCRLFTDRIAVVLLVGSFLAGFILMALEVVWFRFLLLFLFPSSLNFAVLLAVVLAGIALGGLAAAAWCGRGRRAHDLLGAVLFLEGAGVVFGYRAIAAVLPATAPWSDLWFLLSLALVLIFPASFLSGAAFTLMGQTLYSRAGEGSLTAGILNVANTLGGIAGPLIAGFVFLPLLGIEKSFFVLAALGGATALIILGGEGWRRQDPPPEKTKEPLQASGGLRFRRLTVGTAALLFFLALILFPFGEQVKFLDLSVSDFTAATGERRIAFRETPLNTLQLLRKDLLGQAHYYRLVTNNYSIAATNLWSQRYMKLFAYLPLALRPTMERALLLCYGCGNTARALTGIKGLKSIDIVDISPELIDTARLIEDPAGVDPLRDPRTSLHIEDARFFLLTSRETFDLITGEPPPPKAAKIVNLYTREYFRLVRDRLAPGGVATYWLPVSQLTTAETRAVIGAFSEVFADSSLWTGTVSQWILMGTNGKPVPVSEEEFGRPWADPTLSGELQALGIQSPEQLGSLYIAGGRRLRAWVGKVPPLTDDHPARLASGTAIGEEDFRAYIELSDPARSAEDFRDPSGISRLWPPAILLRTWPYFALREIINRLEVTDAYSLRACLTDQRLRDYTLWALGSDSVAQKILARAGLPGNENIPLTPEILRHLAAGAAAGGEYRLAAGYLRRAAAGDGPPDGNFSPALLREMQALLLAGGQP